MTRVPPYDRSNFSASELAIWRRISDTRGGVWGPYAVLMRTPELASRVAAIGEHIRFHGLLKSDLREIAILATAIENQCDFEWFVHEAEAKRAGVTDEILQLLTSRGISDHLPTTEREIIDFVRATCQEKRVSAELFITVESALGQDATLELVTLIGFYSMLAVVLNVYEITPEELS